MTRNPNKGGAYVRTRNGDLIAAAGSRQDASPPPPQTAPTEPADRPTRRRHKHSKRN